MEIARGFHGVDVRAAGFRWDMQYVLHARYAVANLANGSAKERRVEPLGNARVLSTPHALILERTESIRQAGTMLETSPIRMPATNNRANLSFYGAAGTVTGSRYLLQTRDQRILIDCGLFQGYKQLRLRNSSPMAIDASGLYRRFAHEHRLSASDRDLMCNAASFINTAEQSKSISQRNGPMIIISASGMATGGRVIHHLKAFLGNARNLVLLTGFQAPGTRGGSLTAGAATLRIHGEDFPVRAEVRQLKASSSHADANEMLAWMRQLPEPPRQTFITHGEPGASDALRQRIERQLGWSTLVPEYRQTVEVTPGPSVTVRSRDGGFRSGLFRDPVRHVTP